MPGEQLEDRLLLLGIELEAPRAHGRQEVIERRVGRGPGGKGKGSSFSGHRANTSSARAGCKPRVTPREGSSFRWAGGSATIRACLGGVS